jgi:hypothetical protein
VDQDVPLAALDALAAVEAARPPLGGGDRLAVDTGGARLGCSLDGDTHLVA